MDQHLWSSDEKLRLREENVLAKAREPWLPTAGMHQSFCKGAIRNLPCFSFTPVLGINKQEKHLFTDKCCAMDNSDGHSLD